ncbi:MAG: hypothetical protein HY698_02665 [Deltaproteobacteria bacterium]|nr:hypothetical protein [Deltaproteobacteria bacterium]
MTCLVIAACAAWMQPGLVAAERIAVLDMVASGIPDDSRGRFEVSFEEGLRGAGFEVVERADVLAKVVRSDAPEGCTFGPCLAAVGSALGVDLVLVARVAAQGPSYSFVLTIVETKTGVPKVQVADSCAVCTLDEALAASMLAVISLGTGTGGAKLVEPAGGRCGLRPSRSGAWFVTGVAVASSVFGLLLASTERESAGWAAMGFGVGLGLLGGTLLWHSAP